MLQLDSVLTNPKHDKNVALANKVQLMRIKNKASGLKSVPVPDRIYFNIQHPGNPEKVSPLFISKLWTLGTSISITDK